MTTHPESEDPQRLLAKVWSPEKRTTPPRPVVPLAATSGVRTDAVGVRSHEAGEWCQSAVRENAPPVSGARGTVECRWTSADASVHSASQAFPSGCGVAEGDEALSILIPKRQANCPKALKERQSPPIAQFRIVREDLA